MLKKVVEYFTNLWYSIFRIGKLRSKLIMKKGYTAIDIANWFLWYNKLKQLEQVQDNYDVYEGLTHLKIQKLIYYAEGVYSAVTGNYLFNDKIFAWIHGPVVKSVYDNFSKYGKDEIDFDQNQWSRVKEMNENPELYNILETVYNTYAGYTAWQLREKSHIVGGPWQVTVDTKGMQKEIDKKMIKEYFIKNIVNNE